jgi:predicted metal-dependent hydrolase
MDVLLVIVVLFAVVLFVSAPLRRARRSSEAGASAELDELQAAREAKYRELRDAELDHRTGKLSDADYEALERGLRAEAIEILRSIDREQERIGLPDVSAAPGRLSEATPAE